VSSMAGLCSASPNTAVYGATKAFGKSLALAMAKEMEPYGVGVTCLLPGAVRDTQFRDRSGTKRALCWSLPFYPRPADTVAHQGVIALLDGDTQAIPGWQNRVFANIVRPVIPQRFEIACIEAAFSPVQLPTLRGPFGRGRSGTVEGSARGDVREPKQELTARTPFIMESRYGTQPIPRILTLPKREDRQLSEGGHNAELESEEISESIPDDAGVEQSIDAVVEQSIIPKQSDSIGSESVRAYVAKAESVHDALATNTQNSTSKEQESIPFGQNLSADVVKGTSTTAEDASAQPPTTHWSAKGTTTDEEQVVERVSSPNPSNGDETDPGLEEDSKQIVKHHDEDPPIRTSGASDKNPNGEVADDEKRGLDRRYRRTTSHIVDDDEDTLSPLLGPIDIMEHRKFTLPNNQHGQLQPSTAII
jgi:short chain dehydrogenase